MHLCTSAAVGLRSCCGLICLTQVYLAQPLRTVAALGTNIQRSCASTSNVTIQVCRTLLSGPKCPLVAAFASHAAQDMEASWL